MGVQSYAVGQTIGMLIFLLPFYILLTRVFAQIFGFKDKSWKKAAMAALVASGIFLLLTTIAIYLFGRVFDSNPLILIIYSAISLFAAGTISLQKVYKLKEGKSVLIGILWAIAAFIILLFVNAVSFIGRIYSS